MEILWDVLSSAMMLPAFAAVFALLEWLVPERRGSLWRKATIVDIFFYLLGPAVVHTATLVIEKLSGAITGPLLPEALARFSHGIGAVASLPIWAQVIAVALLHDFVGYWVHRWMHGPLLWPIHSAHHTSAQVNWASLFRLHPLDSIFLHICRTLPLVLIGFSPAALAIYGTFFGLWGMVVHANVKLPMGPLRWILVSPIHHHRHHALLGEGEHGKNYAAVFSFWDRIFGTLDAKLEFPSAYGLSPQPPEAVGSLLAGPFVMWREAIRRRGRGGATEC